MNIKRLELSIKCAKQELRKLRMEYGFCIPEKLDEPIYEKLRRIENRIEYLTKELEKEKANAKQRIQSN